MPSIVYEESLNGLTLMEYMDFELRKPSFFILGLPDTGLVGVISANHIVEAMGLQEVAGIDIEALTPPVAVISKGEVRPPLRIYAKDNIMALTAETPVPVPIIPMLSQLIINYAIRKGIDYIVSIVGIATPNRINLEKPHVYWIASNEKAKELASKLGIEVFSNGYLVGPYALILKQAIKKRVTNIVLLADAYVEFPDPEAAASVLTVLSRAIGTEIDVKKLLEQAEMIRVRMRGLMKKTRETMAEMGGPSPLLYA